MNHSLDLQCGNWKTQNDGTQYPVGMQPGGLPGTADSLTGSRGSGGRRRCGSRWQHRRWHWVDAGAASARCSALSSDSSLTQSVSQWCYGYHEAAVITVWHPQVSHSFTLVRWVVAAFDFRQLIFRRCWGPSSKRWHTRETVIPVVVYFEIFDVRTYMIRRMTMWMFLSKWTH